MSSSSPAPAADPGVGPASPLPPRSTPAGRRPSRPGHPTRRPARRWRRHRYDPGTGPRPRGRHPRGPPSHRGTRRPRPRTRRPGSSAACTPRRPGPPVVTSVPDQHHRGGRLDGDRSSGQATAAHPGAAEPIGQVRSMAERVVRAPESTSALIANSPNRADRRSARRGPRPPPPRRPRRRAGGRRKPNGAPGRPGPTRPRVRNAPGAMARTSATRSARRMNSPVRNMPSGLLIRFGMKSSSRMGSSRSRLGEWNRSVEKRRPSPERTLDHGPHLVGEEGPGGATDGVGQQQRADTPPRLLRR